MKKQRHHVLGILGALAAMCSLALLVSCGGGSTAANLGGTTGTVNTYLSDPPSCTEFSHVYVTVTKVTANISATAGPNDSGWQTLVNLSSPTQVDLMTLNPSAQPNFCGTLHELGSGPLPAGKYQQIRLYLLDNSASSGPANNACSVGNNCVVPDGSSNTYELQLSSQAQTGIKIPSSQITSGGLTVTQGQSVDFNIDFDSCASVVQEGNGQYRFKPVLHAGEVTLNKNNLSGTVIEGNSGNEPNPGAPVPNALVLLEQPVTSGSTTVDVVKMSGRTNANGTFDFCPLPPGSSTFDVVVAGQTTQGCGVAQTTTTYNPSVVLGVPVGGSTGNIPIFAETTTGSSTGLVSTAPASITGQITATSATSTAVAGSVQISAFQTVTSGSNTVNLTIPVFDSSSTPADNLSDSQPPTFATVATTSTNGGCATGTADCVGYTVQVPASAVAVGTYSSSTGNNVQAPSSSSSATYTLNALADGSNGLLTCSPASVTTPTFTVSSGSTADSSSVPQLNFQLTGCTAP